MPDEVWVDTARLKSHTDIIDEERRYLSILIERLERAMVIDAYENRPIYFELIRKAQQMENYFSTMSKCVYNIAEIFEDASKKITTTIEDTDYIINTF